MPNSGERNENDLKITNEKLEWLSEISGLALVEIRCDEQVTLSSVARNILKSTQSVLNFKDFTRLFSKQNELKTFFEELNEETADFSCKLAADNRLITLTGKRFPEANEVQVFVSDKPQKSENSTKDILIELERHESQLEVAVQDRAYEIQQLNAELEKYKNEVKALITDHTIELKETEERLNTLSNNLPQGAIFRFKYDQKGTNVELVYAGKFISDLFGEDIFMIKDGERKFLEMIHPEDQDKYLQATQQFNNGSAKIDIEFRIRDNKDQHRWVYMRAKPNSDVPGVLYWDGFLFDISSKKQLENQLQLKLNFESLIVDISTRFINIKYDQVDENINQALKEICLFTKSNIAYIYIFDEDYKEMTLEHVYSNLTYSQDYEKPTKLELDTSDPFFKDLLKKGLVQVNSLEDLDKESEAYERCVASGINSYINIGLFYQNELLGFFGVSSVHSGRSWDKQQLKLLQVIGDIFVGTVKRKQNVQNLLDSEKTYREIYNASSEAIFIHDIDSGKILDVNRATLDLFEIEYEEALKTDVYDLIADLSPMGNRSVLDMIQTAAKRPLNIELQLNRPEGGVFWAEVSLKKAVIFGAERVMAIVRDISTRKESEQLLKDNEEKYRMIVEGQNDLIVKTNTKGEFLFVSLSYCKMFDKTEEELLGSEFMPLVHEEDRESTQLAMEKLFRPPYSCYLEQRARTKDGWRWLAWNDTAIVDEEGNVKEIIGVGRDITYQKMVENALRESEERFRSIVQNLSDVVFLLDEKAFIKYVTPSAEEYLGLAVEELLGYNLKDLVHPNDKWLVEENMQLHLRGDDYTIPYEVRMHYSDTSFRVFEVKSQSLLKHPSVRSIIYTISDITDRKKMEKQVLDAIIKTEEKERERFAKDLHDDLGPLLSSIKMYIGMFSKAKDEEKQQFIINNLHDIVKEAIATTKEVSNDLNPHVLNNYGIVSALDLFIGKVTSDIEIVYKQEIESTRYAPAIELSVYRIAKELINNSLKHSGANLISVKLYEKNDSLCLNFEDNGKGLNESALTARKPGGMGLSNIISRAKSLNANYNFYTNLSTGFKFDLIVPLIQE